MGVSLWLRPPNGKLDSILQSLIKEFASFDEFLGSPIFPPHLTITGDIRLTALSDPSIFLSLIGSATARVEFRAVTYRHSYLIAVPYATQRTQTLLQLAKEAREKLVGDDVDAFLDTYKPHVSLLYTELDPIPEDTKTRIEASVAEALHDYGGWVGGRLALVRCDGPVESWEILAERVL